MGDRSLTAVEWVAFRRQDGKSGHVDAFATVGATDTSEKYLNSGHACGRASGRAKFTAVTIGKFVLKLPAKLFRALWYRASKCAASIQRKSKRIRWYLLPCLEEKNNEALTHFYNTARTRQNCYAKVTQPGTEKRLGGSIDWVYVKEHIRQAMFGETGTKEQDTAAAVITERMKSLNNGQGMVLSAILLCCTSGSGEQDDYEEHRLLRVEIGSTVYFFDAFTRQYEGFEHFLDTSFLPKCYICHPSHGKYTLQPDSEQVDILMVKSNACGILRQLWKMIQWLLFIGACVIGAPTVLSFLPASWVFVLGPLVVRLASAAYDLYDMRAHATSWCSFDGVASWLNIVFALGGSLSLLGKNYFLRKILSASIGCTPAVSAWCERLFTLCSLLYDVSWVGTLGVSIPCACRALWWWTRTDRSGFELLIHILNVGRITFGCRNVILHFPQRFETSSGAMERASRLVQDRTCVRPKFAHNLRNGNGPAVRVMPKTQPPRAAQKTVSMLPEPTSDDK
ncbi:hypothetical protein AAVH_25370 [Aphelenchoides avenae]|nr:hypothetical protein AAVH_25370 [Aphelenchus avenae]